MRQDFICPICRSKIDGIHLENKDYSTKELHLIIYCMSLMVDESGKIKNGFDFIDYIEDLKKETIWPLRRNVLNRALQYFLLKYDNIIKFTDLLYTYF